MSDDVRQTLDAALWREAALLIGEDRERVRDLWLRLGLLVGGYEAVQPLREEAGDRGRQRDRLERIHEASGLLAQLLRNEPLADRLVRAEGETVLNVADQDRALLRLQALKTVLGDVAQNATKLLTQPDELTLWRLEDPGASPNARPWRTYLWEPTFRALAEAGLKVPKTTRGPLIRILAAMHEALRLPPPDPEAVKKAAQAFQAG